jgi:hypothetical protein
VLEVDLALETGFKYIQKRESKVVPSARCVHTARH